MSTLISVIVPTYNREAYILDAVKSVLDQKLPSGYSIEVIVIDDGSTDKTKEVLGPLMGKIRYKKIPNSGRPAVPRNLGIKMSKGKLIAFQDSDDKWAKNKLVNQLKDFDDAAVGLSHGDASEMSLEGSLGNKAIVDNRRRRMSFDSLVQDNFISTLTVMVRKQALDEVGCFDESNDLRGVEDYELWLRIAARYKIAYTPRVLAYYRRHDGNISLSVQNAGESHLFKLLKLTRRKSVYNAQQKILINQRLLGLLEVQKLGGISLKVQKLSLRLRNKLLRLS